MAKSLLKLQARELRRQGLSLKDIVAKVQVARSTVSLWIRDIQLNEEQLERLKQSTLEGAAKGRLVSAERAKSRRKRFINEYKEIGKQKLEHLSQPTDRELLLMGLMLYWGEGSKKSGEFQFCNSDPIMIQFFILWLEKSLGISKEELRCWVGINEIHKRRDNVVKAYWASAIDVPLSQFTGTSFKKVTNKKVYENFEEHYGTLFIRVKKSSRYFHMVMGMLEQLPQFAKVAQW